MGNRHKPLGHRKPKSILASCDAAGVVRFGSKIPRGCLPIGRFNDQDRAAFTAHCRLAYDNKTWLVPGVPEASDQIAGIDALKKFQRRLLDVGAIVAVL